MKKVILSLAISTFVVAAYAGDACCPSEKKAACPEQAKAAAVEKAKTASCCPSTKAEMTQTCPASKGTQQVMSKQSNQKKVASKQMNQKKAVKKNTPAVTKKTDTVAKK